MIVRNIALAKRWNENVPKRCRRSKEVPILVGALLILLVPLPYYCSGAPY